MCTEGPTEGCTAEQGLMEVFLTSKCYFCASKGHHTLGNIVAGNSLWPQCCVQIHQQLCCPFTATMTCHASRGPVKMSLSWPRTCAKWRTTMCAVLKESVWLLHLPSSLPSCYIRRRRRRRCNRCVWSRPWILDRGRQRAFNHFMQEIYMCNTYDLATGILVE